MNITTSMRIPPQSSIGRAPPSTIVPAAARSARARSPPFCSCSSAMCLSIAAARRELISCRSAAAASVSLAFATSVPLAFLLAFLLALSLTAASSL